MTFTLVCAANNEEVLSKNLLTSKIPIDWEVIIQRDCTNVCKAYNDAAKRAKGDILIFVHQDVFLPDNFEADLLWSLTALKGKDWGVLGVAGKKEDQYLGHILDRGSRWGTAEGLPAEVQTLDELLIIVRRNSFQFDEAIPTHHLFGADICLQALDAGKSVWAIDAFCHHNSTQTLELPEEFQLSVDYVKKKWQHRLPIHTTCCSIY